MSKIQKGPLPPDIFDQVNATHALVFLPTETLVVYRNCGQGLNHGRVYKGGATSLDDEFAPRHQRRIKARWLADPRRRELRLSVSAVPCRLTDAEWEGR